MKALVSETSGGPETLVMSDRPRPEPGPGQVRIRVVVCGINYPDVLVLNDRYQFKPERPFSPGAEVSGIVDALGGAVTGLAVGDRVMGGTMFGGLAEQVVIDAWRCFRIPEQMPFDEGAAFLLTYGTSHYALVDRARLKPGETILILGAAGGVGLAAVEIAKRIGATVVAAISTEEKAAVARARGADAAIVYPGGPLDRLQARAFTAAARAAAGGDIDVVYDAVGGCYSEPALRTLGWDGRFLVVGFPAGIAAIPLNLALLKACHIIGVYWGAAVERAPASYRASVATLLNWYCDGELKPLVSAHFPLERGGEAIAALAARHAVGKIVVDIGQRDGDPAQAT